MPASIDPLRGALAEFDGRAVTLLSEAAVQFESDKHYLKHLVILAQDPEDNISSGATWLIKTHLEAGGDLCASETSRLLERLDAIRDWQAQLHICQSIQFLTPDNDAAEQTRLWLAPLLAHKRPFLRAWALDAICHLASLFPVHQGEATRALEIALCDPAASVRARARNLAS